MNIRRSSAWTFSGCALGCSLLFGCHSAKHSETNPERYGWDYGLTHRCIGCPYPQSQNCFEDRSDCPMAGKSWTLAVQSETARGGYGPSAQSFLINSPGSPVHFDWISNDRSSVRLTTDFDTIAHPAGEGYFTWFVLMDHTAHGGGPFPRPDELVSKVSVTFNDLTPHGATRAFVGFGGVWDGKMRGVEVCFAIANWGDNDPAADVIATINNDSLEFATMDGRPLGITAIRNQEAQVEVAWYRIIPDLVRRGYFKPPQHGWEQSRTAAVYVGTEVNNFTASGAARATLSVADFRVERVR